MSKIKDAMIELGEAHAEIMGYEMSQEEYENAMEEAYWHNVMCELTKRFTREEILAMTELEFQSLGPKTGKVG